MRLVWTLQVLLFFVPLVSPYTPLTDDQSVLLKSTLPLPLSLYLSPRTGSILSPILIPRPSGSEGANRVLNHFIQFFTHNVTNWSIQLDEFTDSTPRGDIKFTNFVATRDPPGVRPGDVGRLVVTAHYDSKWFPKGNALENFIGATDSAVPCAMLMYAALALEPYLNARDQDMPGDELEDPLGLQIIFFDGEEAVNTWTNTDSVYGARHLAQIWEAEMHPPTSSRANNLSSIDLFVLFDLLGTSTPRIPSYFPTTHWAYSSMSKVEKKLRSQNLLATSKGESWLMEGEHYDTNIYKGGIEDDHIPFLHRGVEILHIIPIPFPREWHTIDDDAAHLDANTVYDWSLIATQFIAEYTDLTISKGAGAIKDIPSQRGEGSVSEPGRDKTPRSLKHAELK